MKSARFRSVLTASLMLGVALAGCKKNPKSVTNLPPGRAAAPGGNSPGDIATPSGPVGSGLNVPAFPDSNASRIPVNPDGTSALGSSFREEEGNYLVDREVFKQQTAYFDFDRSEVKSSERSKIEQVAAYLRSEANARLRVEGHCDERGTPEYNRALGERRALSAREFLIGLGIAAERIGTLSWGEDKPADTALDETAYAKNRRAEFILLRPKQ